MSAAPKSAAVPPAADMIVRVLTGQQRQLRTALVAAVEAQIIASKLPGDGGELLSSPIAEILECVRGAELSAAETLEAHASATPTAARVHSPGPSAAGVATALDYVNAARRSVARLVSDLARSQALSPKRAGALSAADIDIEREDYIARGVEALGYLEAIELAVEP